MIALGTIGWVHMYLNKPPILELGGELHFSILSKQSSSHRRNKRFDQLCRNDVVSYFQFLFRGIWGAFVRYPLPPSMAIITARLSHWYKRGQNSPQKTINEYQEDFVKYLLDFHQDP